METLKQLWSYNDWANDLVFQVFEKYDTQIPTSALRLLSHIVNTQSTWLNRVLKIPPAVGVWQEHSLEYCKSFHGQTSAELKKLVDDHMEDLYILVEYKNTQGRPFKNTLSDILLHVFNHGTYHRAQIAMDLRQKELEPANTDYITFVRMQ